MVFKCQEDSFLREFASTVLSCDLVSPGTFDVTCEDTILFPEGGGQPHDTGTLDHHQVVSVVRKGSQAIHRVLADAPLNPGQACIQRIDWERRQDHMQQHSGQHLLSALFEQVYNYDTKSWWLGTDTSYIELDNKAPITQEHIQAIEDQCNAFIAQAIPVSVSVYPSLADVTSEEVKRATRGLPADHVGAIRVINIEGVDSNLCCGTHVSNLAQLQAIKLLHLERPNKSKLVLHFLVGNRIGKRFQAMFEREQKMNLLLNNGPSAHLDLVEKMSGNVKRLQKAVKLLSKEAALFEVAKQKQKSPLPEYLLIKKTADECEPSEFQNTLIREAKTALPDLRAVILIMEDKPTSQLLVVCHSDDHLLHRIATALCDVLEIKLGAAGLICKNGRFQAKFTSDAKKNLKKCDQIVGELLQGEHQ